MVKERYIFCLCWTIKCEYEISQRHTRIFSYGFLTTFFVFFLSFSLRKSARTCKTSCCVWLLTVFKLLLTEAWGCTWTLPVAAAIVVLLLRNGNNSHNTSCDSYKTQRSEAVVLVSLESEHVGNCVSCVVSRKKTKESAYFSDLRSFTVKLLLKCQYIFGV